jgi:hypothetical protein
MSEMSEGHSPPPIPPGHEPPPIPDGHEPPSIAGSAERRSLQGTHEPPPIPDSHLTTRSGSQAQEEASKIIVFGEKRSGHGRAFLSWLGLVIALSCIPFALLGCFAPGLRGPFWLAVLILSFVVVSIEKYAKNDPHASTELASLALRLGYGFLFISLIGLVAASVRALLYISYVLELASHAIHRTAESWHESNNIVAWFLHKADVITQFIADHAHHASAASPSPSPTATPSP